MDPFTLAGISLGTSALSSIFGSSQARKERQARRQAEEDARRHNIEMWNMQNEYNHPTAQMARLQEAGLNPNLIYGKPTAAAGVAGDVAKGQAPDQSYYKDFDFDSITPLVQHQNIKQSQAQVDNLRAHNQVLTEDAQWKSAQRAGQLIKNARDDFEFELAKELRDTSLEAMRNNVRLQQEQIFGKQIDNLVNDAVAADRIKTIGLEMQNAVETLEGTRLSNALKQYEHELNMAGVQKNDALWERILMQVFSKYFNDPEERDKLERKLQPMKKWQSGLDIRTRKVNDSTNQIYIHRRKDILEDIWRSAIRGY